MTNTVPRWLTLCGIVAQVSAGAFASEDKTIELWPLEWNAQLRQANVRATTDPLNDFNAPKVGSYETGLSAPAGNRSAFYFQPALDMNCLYNANTAKYMTPTNDFTLEGWMYLKSAPGGNFYVIASAPNLGDGRWLFTLRNVSGSYQWQLYGQGKYGTSQSMGDRVLKTMTASEMNGCLNKWMHWALTYSHGDGSKGAAWHAYLDYQELGAGIQFDTVMTAANAPFTKDYVFSLGGRPNANNVIDGSIDFVRLSSSVLDVSEFMTRTPAAEQPGATVAHWPLVGTESGKVKTDSRVGDRGLSGCLHQTASPKSTIRPSADQAFDGSLNGMLGADNRGSWRMTTPQDVVKVANLGRELDVSNSFTVEGWVNLEFAGAPDCQYVFYTRDSGAQWVLQLAERFVGGNRRWQFEIFAQDKTGNMLHSDVMPYLIQGQPLTGDVSGWRGWKHIALVYDHQGCMKNSDACGVWQMYADGALQGAVTNVIKTTGLTANCQNFYLGGRSDKDSWNFSGSMDCFRVSKRALRPENFLNGQSPEAATDVLALWPLDVDETGAYLDGREVKGNYPIASNYTGLKVTPVVVDGENMTRFYTSANPKATLAVCDPAVSNVLRSAKAYTLECYLRREEALNGWEVVFGTADDNWSSMGLNFSYRSNGFVIFYGGNVGGVNDVAFDPTRTLELGTWTHVALVCRRNTRMEFDLYLDGQKVGNMIAGGLPPATLQESFLMIGGRPWNTNSFRGEIRDVRLTARELDVSEFMCNETPGTRTAAFWTIDKTDGGTLDLLNHVDASSPMTAKGAVAVGRGARSYVPNPDTTAGYIGDPKVNMGGAVLSSDGSLIARNCGSLVDVNGSFTVEGWLKWTGGEGEQIVCGTYTQSSPAGWKLSIDSSGARPYLKITAARYQSAPVVDQAFDADLSDWKNDWRHVALSYDPSVGNGLWTLSVDGEFVSRVENRFPLYGTGFAADDFVVGGSFAGGVDMWRISEGLLSAKSLLYRPPMGLVIILR